MNANQANAGRAAWVPVLGLFTLWLVIQNAIVVTIVSMVHPELPVAVLVEAARAIAHVLTNASMLAATVAASVPDWMSLNLVNPFTGGLL